VSRSDEWARRVTHYDWPEDPPTTTTTTSNVEEGRSNADTLQHVISMPNENLRHISSLDDGIQLADNNHESSPSSAYKHQSLSSSQSLTAASSIQSNYFQEHEIRKIERVLRMVVTMTGVCRVCWVKNEESHTHTTDRCPTRVCSGSSWDTFGSGIQFPGDILCETCLVPHELLYYHKSTSPGTKKSSSLCDYPHIIKELAYILYQDPIILAKVFERLEVSQPSTPSGYETFLTRRPGGEETFGIYEVVGAYFEIREEEEYLQFLASEEGIKSGEST
jgi:hypothetical protein